MKQFVSLVAVAIVFFSLSVQAEDLRVLMRKPSPAPVYSPTMVTIGDRVLRSQTLQAALQMRSAAVISNTVIEVRAEDWVISSEKEKFRVMTATFDFTTNNVSTRTFCKLYYEGMETEDHAVLVSCEDTDITPYYASSKDLLTN